MTGNDLLTHGGITQPVNEWALDYGIYPSVILDRLARGWSVERAITKPMVIAPHQRLDRKHMPGFSRLRRNLPNSLKPATEVEREQNVRHRPGRLYEREGQRLTLVQWCEHHGIKADTVYSRMHKGMTLEQALTAPKLRAGTPWQEQVGVVANSPQPVGTGGGPIAQDFPEIEFSQ